MLLLAALLLFLEVFGGVDEVVFSDMIGGCRLVAVEGEGGDSRVFRDRFHCVLNELTRKPIFCPSVSGGLF